MRMGRVRIGIIAVFFAACFAIVAARTPACGAEPADTAADEITVEKTIVGKSVGGRPIHCEVYGDGPDILMIIATNHGNEAAGTPPVSKFAEWLVADPKELAGHTVVIIPVANPDGYVADKRFNVHEVDLNRNFPAGNWGVPQEPGGPGYSEGQTSPGGSTYARRGNLKPGQTPLSEPESRVLMQLVCRYFPNRIISIHQPAACIDYDGLAAELAAAMGAKCPLPVKNRQPVRLPRLLRRHHAQPPDHHHVGVAERRADGWGRALGDVRRGADRRAAV